MPRAAEATGRDLADRESECCSFFTFEFEPAGDAVVMHISVPPSHVDVLAALQARTAGPLVEVGADGELTVYVQAVDGKANEAVVKLLATHFGVSPSRVEVVSGATSRVKRFRIEP